MATTRHSPHQHHRSLSVRKTCTSLALLAVFCLGYFLSRFGIDSAAAQEAVTAIRGQPEQHLIQSSKAL